MSTITQSKTPLVVNWPLKAETSYGLQSVNHVAAGSKTLCARDVPPTAKIAKTPRIDCPVCFRRFEKGEI